jgi:hypothetical protein
MTQPLSMPLSMQLGMPMTMKLVMPFNGKIMTFFYIVSKNHLRKVGELLRRASISKDSNLCVKKCLEG